MGGDGAYAVGIDIGTTGLKVGVFSVDGALHGEAIRPVETVRLDDGGVEQDAEAIWDSLVEATREAVDASGLDVDEIVAVGVDSQYSSIVPIDVRGHPVGPLILWMDGRGAQYNLDIYDRHDSAFETWIDVHGIMPLPNGADALAKMLWLRHERPNVHDAAAGFVEAMDYATARMTGRLTATQCSAFMLLLTDNRTLDAKDYHDDLIEMSGVERAKLAPIVPMGEPVGPLSAEAADELGLSPETVVLPGLNDTQVAAVGTGTHAGPHAGLSIGTTSVIVAHIDRKDVDIDHEIVSMPSPVDGSYVVMAENGLGGKTLEVFLDNVVFADDPLGDHSTDDPFVDVDAVVAESPPGANGVLFLPWLGGSLAPRNDAQMRGGFIDVALETSRADLVRAVLEGVAHNLKWLLGPVETFAGHEFEHIVFCGGAALSDAWAQILADVLDRPIHQLADPAHANCRASALFALHRLGHLSLAEVSANAAVRSIREPDPDNRALYDRDQTQFEAAFEANQPIFQALNPA